MKIKKLLCITTIIAFSIGICGCSFQKMVKEYSDTRLMMDTVCTIKAGGDNAEAAVSAAFDKIAEIADMSDYYSDSSEVTKINNAPKGTPIPLSEDMYNILSVALDVSEASNGAFDITVAPVKDLWNFGSGDHQPPSKETVQEALSLVGYENLSLNKDEKTLTKSDSAIKIDLGGAAKGYAADCARNILNNMSADYGIIDLGGNILVTGKNPKSKDGSWNIGIQTPFSSSGEVAQTVNVSESAVVTSGIYQRYFSYNGETYHHILNPANGFSSDNGRASASIICPSALTADCLSTACMVLAPNEGEALANRFDSTVIYK